MFTCEQIGNKRFVLMDDGHVFFTNPSISEEKETESLQYNLEMYQSNMGIEKGLEHFLKMTYAKKRPDFSGYRFDGHMTGRHYHATLPLKWKSTDKTAYLQLKAHYCFYRKSDDIWFYSILLDGEPQGSLLIPNGTDIEAFFTDFVTEVISHNCHFLDHEDSSRYFLFSSREIRRNFPFRCAVHVINL